MTPTWVNATRMQKTRDCFISVSGCFATRGGDFLHVHHTLTPDRKSSHSAARPIVGPVARQCVSADGALLRPDTARRRRLNGRNNRPPSPSLKITLRRQSHRSRSRRRLFAGAFFFPLHFPSSAFLSHLGDSGGFSVTGRLFTPIFQRNTRSEAVCLLKFRVDAPRPPAIIVWMVPVL